MYQSYKKVEVKTELVTFTKTIKQIIKERE